MSSHKDKSQYAGDFAIYRCLKCQERWTQPGVKYCPNCNTQFWNTVVMVTQQDYDKFGQAKGKQES